MAMDRITDLQYKAVYNMSFARAGTMATTMVLWVPLHCRGRPVQKEKYDSKPSGWSGRAGPETIGADAYKKATIRSG